MLYVACSLAGHAASWQLLYIPGSMGNPVGKGADGVTPLLQLFKGKFYHCLGVDIRNITNRSDCVAANYKWVHHKYNFDNLGQVSLPTAPSSDGNPSQGLSPPQGTDAEPGKPMPGPEGAVSWPGCPCRSCHKWVGIRMTLTG